MKKIRTPLTILLVLLLASQGLPLNAFEGQQADCTCENLICSCLFSVCTCEKATCSCSQKQSESKQTRILKTCETSSASHLQKLTLSHFYLSNGPLLTNIRSTERIPFGNEPIFEGITPNLLRPPRQIPSLLV